MFNEAVRKRLLCGVLFNEAEKAHPDVMELFFQVFDKRALEDGERRRIDFKNTLVILSSNLGAERRAGRGLGFMLFERGWGEAMCGM